MSVWLIYSSNLATPLIVNSAIIFLFFVCSICLNESVQDFKFSLHKMRSLLEKAGHVLMMLGVNTNNKTQYWPLTPEDFKREMQTDKCSAWHCCKMHYDGIFCV